MPTGTLDGSGSVGWAPALGWDARRDAGRFRSRATSRRTGRARSTAQLASTGSHAQRWRARCRRRCWQPRRHACAVARCRARPLRDARRRRRGSESALRRRCRAVARQQPHRRQGQGRRRARHRCEVRAAAAERPAARRRRHAARHAEAHRRAHGAERRRRSHRQRPELWRLSRRHAQRAGPAAVARGNGAIARDARPASRSASPSTRCGCDARGAVEACSSTARRAATLGTLALAGQRRASAAPTGRARWRRCSSTPAKGAAWRLQQPARFRRTAATGRCRNSCFASSGGGSLCASADWPRRGLDVRRRRPAADASLVPYLPEREDGRPWLLRGEIALDGQLRPVGNAWRGNVERCARPAAACKHQRARAPRAASRYDNLVLDATFDPQTHRGRRWPPCSTTTAASMRASPPAGTTTRRLPARSRSTPTS